MSDTNNNIGKVIGNYRLVAELASGAFGSVYQAKHIIFVDRPVVALKLLHTHLGSQEERDRFIQEARLLKQLEHPHILPIIDAGIHENLLYLVTVYAPNGSLLDRLRHASPYPLPIGDATRILLQIGQALHYAHQQNIIHRDLKPGNILFNARNEALLADFGIAAALGTATTKLGDDATGTPPYMAPEQFEGMISKKSDQYALGCIAYELFTGRRPFVLPPNADWRAWWHKHAMENPTAPRQLNPHLPINIEQAILKALAKQRADRYADIYAFTTALCSSIATQTDGASLGEKAEGHWQAEDKAAPHLYEEEGENGELDEPGLEDFPSGLKDVNKQIPNFNEHFNTINTDENDIVHISQNIPPYVRNAVAALDSASSAERKEAIESLAQTDHPAAYQALIEALEHPIKDVRVHSALALARFKDRRAIPGLIEGLSIDNFANSSDKYTLHGLTSLALVTFGDEAIPGLLKALQDEDPRIRMDVMQVLARLHSIQAVSALCQVVCDTDEGVRWNVPWVFEQIFSSHFYYHHLNDLEARTALVSAVSSLIKAEALRDSNSLVRTYTAEFFLSITRQLTETVYNPDIEVRHLSAWALSSLLVLLQQRSSYQQVPIQEQIARTIHTTLPLLRKAQKDSDEYIRNCINWTLNQIKR